ALLYPPPGELGLGPDCPTDPAPPHPRTVRSGCDGLRTGDSGSGRGDLNPRPPAPKAGALPLRHSPVDPGPERPAGNQRTCGPAGAPISLAPGERPSRFAMPAAFD